MHRRTTDTARTGPLPVLWIALRVTARRVATARDGVGKSSAGLTASAESSVARSLEAVGRQVARCLSARDFPPTPGEKNSNGWMRSHPLSAGTPRPGGLDESSRRPRRSGQPGGFAPTALCGGHARARRHRAEFGPSTNHRAASAFSHRPPVCGAHPGKFIASPSN